MCHRWVRPAVAMYPVCTTRLFNVAVFVSLGSHVNVELVGVLALCWLCIQELIRQGWLTSIIPKQGRCRRESRPFFYFCSRGVVLGYGNSQTIAGMHLRCGLVRRPEKVAAPVVVRTPWQKFVCLSAFCVTHSASQPASQPARRFVCSLVLRTCRITRLE